MLSSDHVRVRRKGDELILPAFDKKRRAAAVALATEVILAGRECQGARRRALEEALAAIECRPSERRMVEGLGKLLLDRCEIESPQAVDVAALRRAVFERAANERRTLADGVPLDKQAVLGAVGAAFGLEPQAVDEALYSDLPSEARVVRVPEIPPDALADEYERSARQAILLKATRVTADVVCRSPSAYRALFGKLKFRRLLHRIERTERGYRIVIDGPHSLFDSVTKYGLSLALVLPALEAADELRLAADLRWGRRRERLTFRYETRGAGDAAGPAMNDDVSALLQAFSELETGWKVTPAARILDVPGLGVCVPDLTFTHQKSGRDVHLEVLGFWSREAAFRRAELATGGLPEPVVFAVSSRLRVSEEILDEKTASALYVYKGVMSPRAVERRLDAVHARLCAGQGLG